MKHLPRIASALYCEPWNILPSTHARPAQTDEPDDEDPASDDIEDT